MGHSGFGDILPDSGEIFIDGVEVRDRSPRQAIAAGIGLVPEYRKEQGLVLDLPVMSNIGLPLLDSLTRFGVVSGRRERQLASRYVKDLGIRTPASIRR